MIDLDAQRLDYNSISLRKVTLSRNRIPLEIEKSLDKVMGKR